MSPQQDAPAPTQAKIHRPTTQKRSWRVTGDPAEARKAQMLIQTVTRKA